VSELDRPWTDTPYLFQNLAIKTEKEVDELKSQCEYVYVDLEMSLPEVEIYLTSSTKNQSGDKTTLNNTNKTFSEKDFRQDLIKSYGIYKDARGWIDNALADSRLGNSVDTGKARDLVAQLADQIIQNPNALVWLTHLKSRDEYTATHCMNVCVLAITFGRHLGLDKESLNLLGLGGLLHDLGKMRIPGEVLNKPGRLTKEEFEIMMSHPSEGHAMLLDDHNLNPTSLHIVLHHHERLDGTGYPSGLSGDEIPMLTRISSIVDVYDAITSDRCYHDGVSPATAMENLFKWSTGNFDQSMLESFIQCVGIYPVGTVVRLNTNDVGLVVATDTNRRLKPVILLALNSEGKEYLPRRLINLSSETWEKSEKPLAIKEILQPGSLGVPIKIILEEELRVSAYLTSNQT